MPLHSQLLAKDIPTAESLKLTSQAEAFPEDPPLPPTTNMETKPQRDEWMLLPPSDAQRPSSSSDRPLVQQLPSGDDSYTDGYGEPSGSGRTLGSTVDFFSSLGSERKRKPQPDKPDPDKVFYSLYSCYTSPTVRRSRK